MSFSLASAATATTIDAETVTFTVTTSDNQNLQALGFVLGNSKTIDLGPSLTIPLDQETINGYIFFAPDQGYNDDSSSQSLTVTLTISYKDRNGVTISDTMTKSITFNSNGNACSDRFPKKPTGVTS